MLINCEISLPIFVFSVILFTSSNSTEYDLLSVLSG